METRGLNLEECTPSSQNVKWPHRHHGTPYHLEHISQLCLGAVISRRSIHILVRGKERPGTISVSYWKVPVRARG